MTNQFDNLLLSSLVLYYDNKILDKGTAYTNVTSQFYATSGDVNGLYAYAAPFKPFVSDDSITNATKTSTITTIDREDFIDVKSFLAWNSAINSVRVDPKPSSLNSTRKPTKEFTA